VRAIAYVISTTGGEEKPFFEALKHAGIETREKDLQIFYGGGKKPTGTSGSRLTPFALRRLLTL